MRLKNSVDVTETQWKTFTAPNKSNFQENDKFASAFGPSIRIVYRMKEHHSGFF